MKRDWWSREFKVMIAVGDSITAGGWASCRERGWTYQLARMVNEYQRIPMQLVNMGIGANLLSTRSRGYAHSGKPAVSERLERHVLSYSANGAPLLPDLLIIACCLNDARGGTSVDLFCSELEEVVRRVRQKVQPLIVVVGPYHMKDFALGAPDWSNTSPEGLRTYNAAMLHLADGLDCLFVDLLAAYGEADWLVHHDGVHGNDLSHRIVANRIFETLASNCSGLAAHTRELEKTTPPWRDEAKLQAEFGY